MGGKNCSKCGGFKSYSEFNKDKKYKDGYKCWCKECFKEYRDSHKEERKEKYKQYYDLHKEEIKEYNKQYYDSHKEEIKEKQKQYNDSHKEERKEYSKKYYKQYYDLHIEEIKEHNKKYNKQYYTYNKEKLNEKHKQYHQDIKDKNIMRINEIIKNIEKYNLINKHNIPIYGYIYKIENIKTGRIYIGQTTRPLTYRYNSNIVKGWINERVKYDIQKFKDEILNIDDFKVTEILDVGICKYHLNKLEVYYINLYDSYNNGYNINKGNHITDDGIGEFKEILQNYNINESELILGGC